MFIVRNRNIFFGITAALTVAAIISIAAFGLSFGIDFTGGTLAQVTYQSERPAPSALTEAIDAAGIKGYSLREANERDYVLRSPNLTDAQRSTLASTMSVAGNQATITQLNDVGPTIGVELRNKALVAIVLVLVCILLFIAFAFRKVSEPISSWVYGLIALGTLAHDVIMPLGFFAFLGYLLGAQVDTLFVTAILTILGYSVHDTIVVFDRTRENLRINKEHNRKEPFEEVAGRSLQQTFARSINTSLTTMLSLLALYLLGPESTKIFSLTLLAGIIAGTYSSIFFATPLLVAYAKWHGAAGPNKKR